MAQPTSSVLDRQVPSSGRGRRAPRLASAPAILDAATTLFLRHGYRGTSMDDIAALAHVSKQTVYTHFRDKQQLFAELVRGNTGRVDDFLAASAALGESTDLERDLRAFARRYVRVVVQPDAIRLRRLVISEASRFPELAGEYYERVPMRVIAALAGHLQRLTARGQLHIEDAQVAATHFAWLILGRPLDEALFRGEGIDHPPAELDRHPSEEIEQG